jgi:D-3-phosphoglycerate dehydrogenase
MPHVTVAGPLHEAGIALLEAAEDVRFDHVTDADPAAYAAHLPKTDGLVLRTQPLTAAQIAQAPALSVVSRHGVGFDAVDADALAARGIPLAIVGDVNSRTVAEHAFALLLAVSRDIPRSAAALRGGDWGWRNRFTARELDGKRLLILGYGRIGRALALRARAFGMTVAAYDPHLPADAFAGAEREADLPGALARADAVSLHLPGGAAPLIGAAELARMKPDAVLVNTARGGLVDEAALADALRAKRLRAAALDVLGDEPPAQEHPLLSCETALITPHSAGLTAECAQRMAEMSVRNVLDRFAGRLDPALVVNGVRTQGTPPMPTA